MKDVSLLVIDLEFRDRLNKDVLSCLMPKINASCYFGPGIKQRLGYIIISTIHDTLKTEPKIYSYKDILAEVSCAAWKTLKGEINGSISMTNNMKGIVN